MQNAAELVIDSKAGLAESPWWDAAAGELVFVDTVGRSVFRWDPRVDELTSIPVGDMVGAAVPRARGGMVLTVTGGILSLDENGSLAELCEIESWNTRTRLNDAKCDPGGRLFTGSISGADYPGEGGLFRVDHDLAVHKVFSGTTISNGMDWNSEGTQMYFIDSFADSVRTFDYSVATGEISNPRILISFGPQDGHPDGMTVDEEGFLWVASFGGGFVRRFTPSGRLDGTVRLPVSNVTSCAFGGDDLDVLYITTARIELTDDQLSEQPYAGGVFRFRPGVRGRLAGSFAG